MNPDEQAVNQPFPPAAGLFFDWTVNVGNVITLLAFILGAVAIFYQMRGDLRIFAGRLDAVEGGLKKLANLMTLTATQSTRLDSHAERLERLERQSDGTSKRD